MLEIDITTQEAEVRGVSERNFQVKKNSDGSTSYYTKGECEVYKDGEILEIYPVRAKFRIDKIIGLHIVSVLDW